MHFPWRAQKRVAFYLMSYCPYELCKREIGLVVAKFVCHVNTCVEHKHGRMKIQIAYWLILLLPYWATVQYVVTILTTFLAADFVESYHHIDVLGIWAILQDFLVVFLFLFFVFLRRFYILELWEENKKKPHRKIQNIWTSKS